MYKIILFFLAAASSLYSSEGFEIPSIAISYPHFTENSDITKSQKKKIKPYLLPLDHPLKGELDRIFTASRVVSDQNALIEAGFTVLHARYKLIWILKHPNLHGVIIKLYLDDEERLNQDVPGWEWLVQRCEGASDIRKLARKENFKFITVPDKWLYPLPAHPLTRRNPVILIATDMKLMSDGDSVNAWKKLDNKQAIDELFLVLSHGYASTWIPWNIPATRKGTFACIDTEYPKRNLNLKNVTPFLSPPMQTYWKRKAHLK